MDRISNLVSHHQDCTLLLETVHRTTEYGNLAEDQHYQTDFYKLIIYDHRLNSWPGINASKRDMRQVQLRALHEDTRDAGKSASIICVLINASVIQRE